MEDFEYDYTYSGPDQRDRVTVNTTTFDSSGLGLSRQTDSPGTTHYVRCSCGLLNNERTPDGHKHYYLFDSLGSVVGLTDPAGTQLVDIYSYDPTGNILTQTGTVPNTWQYAGGYFNQNTGLTKFGERYYDPTISRWTQQDPVGGSLGSPDSLNRYLYVNDDPVNVTDSSGKSCVTDAIAALIGLVSTTADGFLAGLGLFAVAAGEVTLTAGLLFSWFFFPIAATEVIGACTGYNYSLF